MIKAIEFVVQCFLVLITPFIYASNSFASFMTKGQQGDRDEIQGDFYFYASLAYIFIAYTIIALCILVFLQATGSFHLGHIFVATISVIAASVVTTIVVFVGESRG